MSRDATADDPGPSQYPSAELGLFRRLPRNLFVFTTTDNAALHTAVMQVFGEANERLETALTFDDVAAALPGVGWLDPVDGGELQRTLTALVSWSLVAVTQNHTAQYATAEEYERRNLQYSLTKQGESAFEGVQHALASLASSGALQSAVLEAIATRLDELRWLLGTGDADDRRVFVALTELENHLDGLRANTKQFNNELQRLLRDEAADFATFQDVKQATVVYLEEFVKDLDVNKQRIADAVGRLEAVGVAVLHHRALLGADLPQLPGTDQAPRWLHLREAKWAGLRAWFRPVDGGPARIDDLRAVAQRAIVALLRVLERLREARRRPSNTAADFRTLARWFSACPSEAAAHRLFNAAFGLWPARHAHLIADDPEATPASVGWADAPPVPVSPLLRSHGQTEKVARTGQVRDTAELRRRRQAAAARERAELEAAWRRLATNGTVRLSAFARLDHDAFERLLELLGRALGNRPDRTGTRRAATVDGRLELVLNHPGDGRMAVVETTRGRLTASDYTIRIQPLLPSAQGIVDDGRAAPPATGVETGGPE
jgi:uncharacterized protein (TIGR02677 family)